jgi:hypothetical protein
MFNDGFNGMAYPEDVEMTISGQAVCASACGIVAVLQDNRIWGFFFDNGILSSLGSMPLP